MPDRKLDAALGLLAPAPEAISNFIPLFEHAKVTADGFGHPHTLTRKEWDASKPPHTGQAVVARFGTWRKFIKDNAGIDAFARSHEKWADAVSVLMNDFADKMEAQGLLNSEHTFDDATKEDLIDWIWFHLTGVH